MFYVSSFDRRSKLYGITDTADGVTEQYTKEQILSFPKNIKIKGVSGKTVQVVDAALQVAQTSFDRFEAIVRKAVDGWTDEACTEIARSAHFVRKIKGLEGAEMRRVVMDNIYPQNIREAVAQASDFSNQIVEVDVTNQQAVLDALRNHVCVVLQHKTNGVLTSFMCSGSIDVLDRIYEPCFFDSVYLTKQLYGYTYNIERMRPKSMTPREKNPNMLNVFSCALRFRREGKNHDGANKELSSPFYTVNLERLLGMFVLMNPHSLGDRILPEFRMVSRKDSYNFDFEMYKMVRGAVMQMNKNPFLDKKLFSSFIDGEALQKGVDLTEAMSRFESDFDYMIYLRKQGYSFKKE